MALGLRIRKSDGTIVLDTSTGMTRMLGTVTTTAGSSGSVSHTGLSSGTPYLFSYPVATPNFG
jgi:hypothetical protein